VGEARLFGEEPAHVDARGIENGILTAWRWRCLAFGFAKKVVSDQA